MNGVSAGNFALDMGFSLKKAVNLESSALEAIAICGGLSDIQVEELVSWTGRAVGDVRMVFRDEVFVSRALRNPVVRGCPACLRDDVEAAPDHPLTQMAMRGDWQLREASYCVEHQHPLVPLWKHSGPVDRYDLSSRFAEILDDIVDGRCEQPATEPTPYDRWLTDRLSTGADDTWLKNHSVYASTTFCVLLGTELLRLHGSETPDAITNNRLAQAMGFGVAKDGAAVIRDALDELAAAADGENDKPLKAFGRLYADLGRAHLDKDDFALFRGLLRDCIVETWPVAKGENVLGFVQPERRLHSVHSAAQEAGVGHEVMEKILIHVGAIAVNDERPRSRKTFDAKPYADVIVEIPTLVGPTEMRQAMGATHTQLRSLEADGVLRPRFDIPSMKSPWRVSDGLAFVEELTRLAESVDASDDNWEPIQEAKKRSGLGVGSIIAEIRDGTLRLGKRVDLEGYASLFVLKSEIDQMRDQEQGAVDRCMLTAAAFGRSVGIRSPGWFESLAEAGHTPATRMPHPKWGGQRVYASPSDVEKFHERFLTFATMAREYGQDRRSLVKKLEAAGVKTFSPNGENYGNLFLREDIKGVLFT